MAFHKSVVSFNAGEASPLLNSRSDLQKYGSLCQRLDNFLILPYGGALRRPGTEYLGTAKLANKRCRLVNFNFSVTTNFILEFGDLYIRFWSNSVQVQKSSAPAWVTATPYVVGDYVTESSIIYYCLVAHTSGTFATDLAAGKWVAQTILERPTPYLEADLRALQFCQINDIVYITHPSYPVGKLTRLADNNWTYAEVAWEYPPVLDENDTEITLDPSGTTGSITITASAAVFQSGHVGSYWAIGHRREGAWKKVDLEASDATSSALRMIGQWELTTYGNWNGQLFLERKALGSSIWEVMREWVVTSTGSRNFSSTGREEKLCDLRLRFKNNGVAGSLDPEAVLEVADNRQFGVVQITGFTSSTSVSATVTLDLWSGDATKLWHEAAFSNVQGFPRSSCLHESRLVFGGTSKKPLSVHGSVIDDFENFRPGSLADEAFFFTIASNESNPINWMISQAGVILIGNAGEEWTLERSDDNEALSPVNVRALRQSSYGSAYTQARLINEVVMFVQRQGKKLREMTFAFEKDGWVSPDLTLLAPHITGTGIVETAFQQQPDAVFWVITSDGKLAGMTYERDQNVVGWHPHDTEGEFESVGTIYGGSGADEVWFSVKRTINSATVRYIERLKTNHRDSFENGDKTAWWYLDCGKRTTSGSAFTVVTGLSHLQGKTVAVFADGAVHPNKTVASGQITLDYAVNNVLVGLPYTSVLKPMPFEIPLPDGSTKSRRARVHRLAVQVYKSLAMQVSGDEMQWDDVFFRNQQSLMDDSPPVFTGKKKVSVGASYEDFAEVSIRTAAPIPLCVLSMTPVLDFFGSE